MTYAYTVPEPQPAPRCDYFLDTEPQRPCGRPAVAELVRWLLSGEGGSERHPRCHYHKRLKAPDGWLWVPAA